MKKKIIMIFLFVIGLYGCGSSELSRANESMALNEQTIEQLQLDEVYKDNIYNPINYNNQKSVWFTMMDFEKALKHKSSEDFTENISSIFEKIKNTGFNTIYVHVKPYNYSYYKSEISPISENFPSEYDALEIIINQAHSCDLSVHGWINPLRCQGEEEIKKLDGKFQVKKWYDEKSDYLSSVDGRFYLNPAYDEVREYISEGVSELLDKYQLDGIHIDDYFYPTQNEQFDKISFEMSKESDLNQWRKENINKMVKEIYNAVKGKNSKLLFGISPQGNMTININNLYADVEKWGAENGYCDYIVPQLYYGFKNESKPFEETLQQWKQSVSCEDIQLVVGICMYKIGQEDKWAGSGKNEWIDDKNIPSRQIEYALDNDCSIAVYSVETLFDEKNKQECALIGNLLKED